MRQSPSFLLSSCSHHGERPCHQWQESCQGGLCSVGSIWGWPRLETGSRKKHPPSNVPVRSLQEEQSWTSLSFKINFRSDNLTLFLAYLCNTCDTGEWETMYYTDFRVLILSSLLKLLVFSWGESWITIYMFWHISFSVYSLYSVKSEQHNRVQ